MGQCNSLISAVILRAYDISLPKHDMYTNESTKEDVQLGSYGWIKRRSLVLSTGICNGLWIGSKITEMLTSQVSKRSHTRTGFSIRQHRLCYQNVCTHGRSEVTWIDAAPREGSIRASFHVLALAVKENTVEKKKRQLRKAGCNQYITHAIQRSAACSGPQRPQRAYVCPPSTESTLVKDRDELLHFVLLRPHDKNVRRPAMLPCW